jgi:ABC-2 type transport system permease protein
MRNMLLVMRREYLERVQKKSFLIMTIVVPALMAGVIWIPVKYASRSSLDKRSVTIVAPTQDLAEAVKTQLLDNISREDNDPFSSASDDQQDSPPENQKSVSRYTVNTSTALDESSKQELREQVNTGKLDGYLWIDPESLQKRKFTYYSKDSTNFSEQVSLKSAMRAALTQQELAGHGLNGTEIKQVLKPVTLNAVRVLKGKESKNSGMVLFLATITMVTLLYVTVLIYGLAVMRSVIEEKSSRIMEVMLSSVTPRDMMGGKIIGVGAVGLTQIAIWILLSIALSAPAMIALKSMAGGVHLPVSSVAFFALFFLLGYLLYSTLYAAIGAMVNSEQEAQQIQFIILLPLIFAMIIAQTVIQHPNSQLAIWTSMIPFCAPMLMFVRILVETPSWWQIVLCVALMLATIWGLLLLCARIYRVGVLMYGKRPTLPELLKWLRSAG